VTDADEDNARGAADLHQFLLGSVNLQIAPDAVILRVRAAG
jgi:hypothetical protein